MYLDEATREKRNILLSTNDETQEETNDRISQDDRGILAVSFY